MSYLVIIEVSTVPVWVNGSNCTNRSVLSNGRNAPRVVGVFRNDLCILIRNGNDVTLQVLEEVIRFAIILDTAYRIFIVIHRDNGVAAPRFFEDFGTVQNKGMLDSIYSLTRSDPVGIVGVLGIVKGLELSALLPSQRMTEIACRVALCVVGDGLAVAGGQQVFPYAVAVGVSLAVL